ncbi:hypothetical protein ACWT_0866 [Actinoplanes sp. SE50]|uniref:hypothetical protein n=1 Tax=unclassified Actinoplanes TaxID=2626549 RepID=UPI00023EC200|nr:MULTISPECIES: hypothetical protein [unclassified Actinoplanes]AEV81880.1 hypothetical protein ACPL_983 [Actinoplanes sp. SE50/110]ATO80281.1 hypothetical protein ACWT_0866 [Actinoplanes sp. SE50]SLL97686.1 hypothetical protein ACSP50_0895 [Actinoplanes sp. SE50/110]
MHSGVDPGFDRQFFAQMLGAINRFDDRDFIAYGLEADQVAAMPELFRTWQADTQASPPLTKLGCLSFRRLAAQRRCVRGPDKFEERELLVEGPVQGVQYYIEKMSDMDRILLTAPLIEAFKNLTTLKLDERIGILDGLEGHPLEVTRVVPSEVADAYQVRGEIAREAGKTLSGHADFVAVLQNATSNVYIGSVDSGRFIVFAILDEESRRPLAMMLMEHEPRR